MSEFEEQADDNNAICPYCGNSYQVESEYYDEDSREEKCDTCGNKYWLSQYFSVTHKTRPDCTINGQDHQYELVELSNSQKAEFCLVCGDCRI